MSTDSRSHQSPRLEGHITPPVVDEGNMPLSDAARQIVWCRTVCDVRHCIEARAQSVQRQYKANATPMQRQYIATTRT